MIQELTHLTILVKDQQEALDFYTKKLGFEVHTDAIMHDGMRWITLCTPGNKNFEFALMPAQNKEDESLVGKQGGSYSVGVLKTDNCKKTYQTLKERGVTFLGEPVEEPWGTGVVFKDLYGNLFYLSQPPTE